MLKRFIAERIEKSINPITLRFVGLDISTSSTGYSVIDVKNNVIKSGTIPLQSTWSLAENGKACETALKKIKEELSNMKNQNEDEDPKYIVGIEKPMMAFGNAGWNTKGLVKLAQFNGIVSFLCSGIFQCKEINYIHPTKARSILKINSSEKIPIKERVFHAIYQKYSAVDTIDWKVDEKNKPTKLSFDLSDALSISLYTAFEYKKNILINDKELFKEFLLLYREEEQSKNKVVNKKTKNKDKKEDNNDNIENVAKKRKSKKKENDDNNDDDLNNDNKVSKSVKAKDTIKITGKKHFESLIDKAVKQQFLEDF